jgi:hypothetical protein
MSITPSHEMTRSKVVAVAAAAAAAAVVMSETKINNTRGVL